jgi:hypothetical protein
LRPRSTAQHPDEVGAFNKQLKHLSDFLELTDGVITKITDTGLQPDV